MSDDPLLDPATTALVLVDLQVFAEEALAAFTEQQHRTAMKTVFPRIGRVRSAATTALR